MDKIILVQNIKKYCALRGVKPTIACRESGAGASFISNIETRGQTPSVEKVQQLAAYLGVTVSDLLGETAPVSNSDTKEKTAAPEGSGQQAEFTRLFESLSPQQQKTALAMLRALKETE